MTGVSAPEVIESVSMHVNRFLGNEVSGYIKERADSSITEPLLYSYLAGGKRIRPVLLSVTAGYIPGLLPDSETRKCESYYREVLFAGAAIEAVHTYSLIHDDLPSMDNDDYRRGRKSCHKEFNEWKAVLAGDALNTLAFELLLQVKNNTVFRKLTEILSKAAGLGGMICGQTLDITAEKESGFLNSLSDAQKTELLKRIHKNKTGALLRAAPEMGAVLAGYPDPAQVQLYGDLTGLLFQITDDILDVEGDLTSLGKTAGKDAAAGKLTYPALYGMEATRKLAAETAEKAALAAAETELPSFTETGILPEYAESVRSTVRGFLTALPEFILNRKK